MRRSKRYYDRDFKSTTVSSQNKRFKFLDNSNSSRRNSSSRPTQILYDIMLPHVCYKIMSSSPSNVDNIAFFVGQGWDIVSKVLFKLKYLPKYKEDFRTSLDKFKELITLQHACSQLSLGTSYE